MLYNTLDRFWSVSLLKTTSKHLCSQNSRERSANNLCKLYASEAPSTTNPRDWNVHKKVAWQCTAPIFLTSLTIRYHVNHYWLQCCISFSRKSIGTSAETSLCATGRRHENLRLYRSGHLPKNLQVLNAAALYLSHKCCATCIRPTESSVLSMWWLHLCYAIAWVKWVMLQYRSLDCATWYGLIAALITIHADGNTY